MHKFVRYLATSLLATVSISMNLSAQTSSASPTHNEMQVPGDRWMEIDLYWFDRTHLDKSVHEFWDRFEPLYQGIQGDRGLILNVGWTVGYIMNWSGSLDQTMRLPQGTGQQPWVSETSSLPGTTQERMKAWKDRFSRPIMVQKAGYGPWTYADVKRLRELLRAEGVHRGISNFKVGSLVYAWDNAYGEVDPWFKKHPEAISHQEKNSERVFSGAWKFFDPAAKLHADNSQLGGMPHGIVEGTPAHTVFAAQWGSMSKAVGLDALILRDSFGFPVPYTRSGPKGIVAPSAEWIQQSTAAVSSLVREVKLANPRSILMMYSNAASAVSDWRSNGCDLEKIAKEGYLDVFVDQTWAGAWNEVGVRHANFWNSAELGWTYQLTYMLVHGAMLADTNVKHFPLVETFDAWESWDVLHTVPERLRWGIWAYSHAGVKTPHGLVMPQGSYISWANQGKRLLSADDVNFLSQNIGEAVRDAHATVDIKGPTIVYSHSAMAWEAQHAAPNRTIKEWIDEQVGSAAKWPLPVLSATRIEWLGNIKTDLAIVQTPVHLKPSETAALQARIDKGLPTALLGSFSGGIDSKWLQTEKRTSSEALPIDPPIHEAQLGKAADGMIANVGSTFKTRTNVLAGTKVKGPSGDAFYTIDGEPQLLLVANARRKLMIWDPPDFLSISKKPLSTIWGGKGESYAIGAAAMNSLLRQGHVLHAKEIDADQTMSVAAWTTRDGQSHLLFGNVEEGLRDDADMRRHATMVLPQSMRALSWKSRWMQGQSHFEQTGNELPVDLAPVSSLLLTGRPTSHTPQEHRNAQQ